MKNQYDNRHEIFPPLRKGGAGGVALEFGMNCDSAHRTPRSTFRRSFTLVELLSAMAVVAILVTLVVQVLGAFVSQAKESATKVTLSKIQALLSARQQALDRLIHRKGYLINSQQFAAARNYSSLTTNQQNIIAVKFMEQNYFPQKWMDILQTTQAQVPKFQNALSNEFLYDFLVTGSVVGGLGETSIGSDAFSPSEVHDRTDALNNSFTGFYDAWGNRLRFYRWPTRLFSPLGYDATTPANTPIDATTCRQILATLPTSMYQGNLSADLRRDPDDPLGICANIPSFETLAPGGLHTPMTYHVMLVVSAGPDGVIGFYEPEDVSNNGHLAAVKDQSALSDDIVYLSLRAGGK